LSSGTEGITKEVHDIVEGAEGISKSINHIKGLSVETREQIQLLIQEVDKFKV
jgi:hypothetical protein